MRACTFYLAVVSFAFGLLSAGCSTPTERRTAWQGGTGAPRGLAQLQADERECELLRQQQTALGAGAYRNPHSAYFECMAARGWRQVPEPFDTAGDYCVSESTKAGDRLTGDDGRRVHVRQIVGFSQRCSPKYPILVQVEFE